MVIMMVQTFIPVDTDSKLMSPNWEVWTVSLATILSSGSQGMKLSPGGSFDTSKVLQKPKTLCAAVHTEEPVFPKEVWAGAGLDEDFGEPASLGVLKVRT